MGDCFGETYFRSYSTFESRNLSVEELILNRELAISNWLWTDDSNMAFSIFNILKTFGKIDEYSLAQSFAERYEVGRGYGPAMHGLLQNLKLGGIWHQEAKALFNGQGSFGNGSAMRVSPVGAFFADNLKKVCVEAEKSAIVTHINPEAIVGAIAVAVATALAWKFKQEKVRPNRKEFIEEILPFLNESEVRKGTRLAQELDSTFSTKNAAEILGCGYKVSCPDTVPFCLYCAWRIFGQL
ncbi:MAG TPA: ADP-ribosylglycohydrolase family protein [Pyrinomonadaceae bacterium]|nr:ADP-ribosylglycohydrolase family protein [Pyrinomonadaceae bacterium]